MNHTALVWFALLIPWTGACAPSTEKTQSVHTVLSAMKQLNGKTVQVVGYLPKCGGLECTLYSSEQEYADAKRIYSAGKLPDFLAVGHDPKFDQKARPLAGHYVLLTGTITTECRITEVTDKKFVCPDRGPDIKPIDVRLATAEEIDGRVRS